MTESEKHPGYTYETYCKKHKNNRIRQKRNKNKHDTRLLGRYYRVKHNDKNRPGETMSFKEYKKLYEESKICPYTNLPLDKTKPHKIHGHHLTEKAAKVNNYVFVHPIAHNRLPNTDYITAKADLKITEKLLRENK